MSANPRIAAVRSDAGAPDASTTTGVAPVPGPLAIQRAIAAYRDPIVRGYSWGRFKIFRQRFLQEIGQYLPETGRVLDVGCGFGLFALYYAQTNPGISIDGFDLSRKRIGLAKEAAARLGVSNAHFEVQNATELRAEARYDAVYMLDIIHHVPESAVETLLTQVHELLPPGGTLLVKDLDTTPAWQRIFAHVLDLAMSPTEPPRYWSTHELRSLLTRIGFDVKLHAMVDILPYPHVLYVARRR
ncbi:MAG: class I SAM-dependent methyltransferase [Myxococcota bacterium]|nr:class I SAM-dependent methyltransferase [Myxococcota bacterium]